MHREIISRLLSKPGINVFDEFIKEIEAYFHRPVTSIDDMKDRDNMKKKGDIWEHFCKDWLASSGKYINVWLLNEFNKQFEGQTNLPKQDNGIDIIAQTPTGFHAIQAKYRSGKKYVDWKSLSTFVGLCSRTGPWEKQIVITNCSGVSYKLLRTPRDQSICIGTFRSTTREQWLKIIGTYTENRLTEEVQISKPKTIEELRAARLAKFT